MKKIEILLLLVILFSICLGSYAQNCTNYTDCYSCDDPIIDYSNDFIAMLSQGGNGYDQFCNTSNAAIAIMNEYPGVITDDDWILHMTIDYMCCYSIITYGEIINIMAGISWEPLQLRFSKVICNYGGDDFSDLNSIIVLLDDESQAAAAAFIKTIENAINASGIPIHKPRSAEEPFHSTLGVVDSGYPIDKVIDQINQQFPVFNSEPIIISSFFSILPPWIFNANGSSEALDSINSLPFKIPPHKLKNYLKHNT